MSDSLILRLRREWVANGRREDDSYDRLRSEQRRAGLLPEPMPLLWPGSPAFWNLLSLMKHKLR